jgi:hypothetical protein
MPAIPLLWTNDDITVGCAQQHRRQLDFLDELGIPGVFFVIPRAREQTIDQDVELMTVIEQSRQRGHEYYQHGHVHTPFESGVPETWMLDFAPEVRRRYDEHRLEIEAQHTLERLVEMIDQGHRIWRTAFGEPSPGYRPGWGAICGNLYRALEALGFAWVSSRITSPTSWLWNQGRWDEPMNFRTAVPAGPVRIGRLIEYPIGGDYAFQVPDAPQRIDAMVDLGLRECQWYHERGLPMLIVSHWHGLERNGGTGYAVHARLLAKLLADGCVQPMGMTGLHQRYTAQALTPATST